MPIDSQNYFRDLPLLQACLCIFATSLMFHLHSGTPRINAACSWVVFCLFSVHEHSKSFRKSLGATFSLPAPCVASTSPLLTCSGGHRLLQQPPAADDIGATHLVYSPSRAANRTHMAPKEQPSCGNGTLARRV